MQFKEPGVCRIFFSSPFRGLEIEREELTKKYWPQIRSLCNARGLQFVPVDMRWGITSELSDSAQTIKICLREINRSDMFIGFFGQRYGWHGADDTALQENFDEALSMFPWLEKYRDRSVTELEFLHGHLNNPGNLPAYICFRDKGYDDEERKKAEKEENKRRVAAFSSESDHATMMMDDLKRRVKETEEQCLGINMAYEDPRNAAQEMFKFIMQYLQKHLAKGTAKELSWMEKELSQHDAYAATRRNLYFGGEQYMKQLDEHINSGSSKPLAVVADNGFGKSALLSTWVKKRQELEKNNAVAYVFVGSSEKSTNPEYILHLIIEQMKFLCGEGIEKVLKEKKSVAELQQDLQSALSRCASLGKRVIVTIDGLDKVEENTKTHLPLHWLPLSFPAGVHIIVSTSTSHERSMAELVDARGGPLLEIQPLDTNVRNLMCTELLKLRGKEFSAAQLDKVVNAKRSGGPLFLKVIIEELCAFGNFRKLDNKIDSLRNSESVQELFEKVLERLEEDYNVKGSDSNIIEKVLCALCMSRKGLSEEDIVNMLGIPTHVWSPLFYALEPFLLTRSGLLKLMYDEMKQAVQKRYIHTESERKDRIGELVQYMYKEMLLKIAAGDKVPPYWMDTLPWLCREADLKAKLLKLLTTCEIFEFLLRHYQHELLEYWNFLGAKGQEIESLYMKYAINRKMADIYVKELESYEQPNPIEKCLESMENFAQFLGAHAGYYPNALNVVRKMDDLVETNSKLSRDAKFVWRASVYGSLASTYGLLNDFRNSLKYHLKRADLIEREHGDDEISDSNKAELSVSYHGAGTAYAYVGELEKAKKLLYRSIEICEELNRPNKELNIAESYENLAHACVAEEKFDDAVDLLERALQMKEKYFFGQQHLNISYSLTNLGIAYRKVGRYNDASRVYARALEIKKQLLGSSHADVAIAFGNLSNLAREKGDLEKAEEYGSQAWNVYEEIRGQNFPMAKNMQENLAGVLIQRDKIEEAEKHFWEVYEWRLKNDDLDRSLPYVVRTMLEHFRTNQQWDKLLRILPVFLGTTLSEPNMAILLRAIDVDVMGGKGPERPYEHSIDKQLELFPSSFHIITSKCAIDLIPKKDLEKMKQVMKTYIEASEEGKDVGMDFIGVQEQCDNAKWPEGGVEMLKFGHELLPSSEVILRNLCAYHTQNKIWDKAIQYWKKLIVINAEVPQFYLGLAHCFAMQGEIDEARGVLKTAREKWADNSAVLPMIQEKSSLVDQVEKMIKDYHEGGNS